jgi:hypothetical protein
MRSLKRAAVGLLALAAAACATRSEIRSLPMDAGVARTYDKPFDRVRLACRDALGELAFNIKEGEQDTGFIDETHYRIIATQGLAAGTMGRIARIMIENQKSQCAVWVVVRSKVESREAEPADQAIAEDLHKRIAARLAK